MQVLAYFLSLNFADGKVLALLRGLYIFVAAKYVFLTCTVPVLEIEGSAAIFPRLNLINVIFNFSLSNSRTVLF